MATLEPLDVLNGLEEESDWNESDEGESGFDDDSGKFDYLTEAQVMYSLFSGRLSVSCRGLADEAFLLVLTSATVRPSLVNQTLFLRRALIDWRL